MQSSAELFEAPSGGMTPMTKTCSEHKLEQSLPSQYESQSLSIYADYGLY